MTSLYNIAVPIKQQLTTRLSIKAINQLAAHNSAMNREAMKLHCLHYERLKPLLIMRKLYSS